MSKKFSHLTIQALSTELFNFKKQRKLSVHTGFVFEAFHRQKTALKLKIIYFPSWDLTCQVQDGTSTPSTSSTSLWRLPPEGEILIREGRRHPILGWAPIPFPARRVNFKFNYVFTETKDLVIQRLNLWAQLKSRESVAVFESSIIAWSWSKRPSCSEAFGFF